MSSKSSPSTSREQTPEPAAERNKKSQKATVEDLSEEEDIEQPEAPTDTDPKPESETPAQPAESSSHGWQAIFSPQHNAYYFFNSITQETTWVNPLQPEASSSTSAPAAELSSPGSKSPEPEASSSSTADTSTTVAPTSHYKALQEAAIAQGIDPALAHLDPSLLSAIPGTQTNAAGIPLFTAKFNRHTGAFARPDARDPSHLSEHERAKRMSQFYFDVDKWQDDLAKQGGSIKGPAGAGDEWEDDGQGGRKRKRPTKKDMEAFKEKKKQKKLAKTAWLRN